MTIDPRKEAESLLTLPFGQLLRHRRENFNEQTDPRLRAFTDDLVRERAASLLSGWSDDSVDENAVLNQYARGLETGDLDEELKPFVRDVVRLKIEGANQRSRLRSAAETAMAIPGAVPEVGKELVISGVEIGKTVGEAGASLAAMGYGKLTGDENLVAAGFDTGMRAGARVAAGAEGETRETLGFVRRGLPRLYDTVSTTIRGGFFLPPGVQWAWQQTLGALDSSSRDLSYFDVLKAAAGMGEASSQQKLRQEAVTDDAALDSFFEQRVQQERAVEAARLGRGSLARTIGADEMSLAQSGVTWTEEDEERAKKMAPLLDGTELLETAMGVGLATRATRLLASRAAKRAGAPRLSDALKTSAERGIPNQRALARTIKTADQMAEEARRYETLFRKARVASGNALVKLGQRMKTTQIANTRPGWVAAGALAGGAGLATAATAALTAGAARYFLTSRFGTRFAGKATELAGRALRKTASPTSPYEAVRRAAVDFRRDMVLAAGGGVTVSGLYGLDPAMSPEARANILASGVIMGPAGTTMARLEDSVAYGLNFAPRLGTPGEITGEAAKPRFYNDAGVDRANGPAFQQLSPDSSIFIRSLQDLLGDDASVMVATTPEQYVQLVESRRKGAVVEGSESDVVDVGVLAPVPRSLIQAAGGRARRGPAPQAGRRPAPAAPAPLEGVDRSSGVMLPADATASGRPEVIINVSRGLSESPGHEVTHALLNVIRARGGPLAEKLKAAEAAALKQLGGYDSPTFRQLKADYEGTLGLGQSNESILEEWLAEHGSVILAGLPLRKLGADRGIVSNLYDAFLGITEAIRGTVPGYSDTPGAPVTSRTLGYAPSVSLLNTMEHVFQAYTLEKDGVVPSPRDLAAEPSPPPLPSTAPAARQQAPQQTPQQAPQQAPQPAPAATTAPAPAATTAPAPAATTAPAPAGAAVTAEAADLIASVDAGGVPSVMTRNLVRIAEENGIEVTGTMRPMDVVDALRSLQQRDVRTSREPQAAQPAPAATTAPAPGVYTDDAARRSLAGDQATPEIQEANQLILDEELDKAPPDRQPLQTDYNSAKDAEIANPLGLTEPQRAEQRRLADEGEAAGIADQLRALYDKVLVPIRRDPSGKNLFAFSVDKVIRNLDMLGRWLQLNPETANRILEPTGYSSLSDPKLAQDVQSYLANQANGYRGDGGNIVLPEGTDTNLVPARNPDYRPVALNPEAAKLINSLMGVRNITDWGEGAPLSKVFAIRLAEANGVPMVESTGGGISDKGRRLRPKAEFNSMNKDLRAAGFDTNLLHVAIENLRISRMGGVLQPRPDLAGLRAPSTAFVQASFMPAPPIDSPAFKNWFGDWSKPNAYSSRNPDPIPSAVIRNGKPLVVYHGTRSDFTEFRPEGTGVVDFGLLGAYDLERSGIFFTPDPEVASAFADRVPGSNVIPAYLNLRSPADLTTTDRTFDVLEELGLNGRRALQSGFQTWSLFDGPEGLEFVSKLKEAGYDGATLNEYVMAGGRYREAEVFVALEPEQVKSATGNVGTFDPTNPDIRYMPATRAEAIQQVNDQTLFGATFKLDGVTDTDPHIVVTFQSENVPQGELTEASIDSFVAKFPEAVRSNPDVRVGVFNLESAPETSIDLNLALPQDALERAATFARANGQESIWDGYSESLVRTGGDGNARLTTADIPAAIDYLEGRTDTLPPSLRQLELEPSPLGDVETLDPLEAQFMPAPPVDSPAFKRWFGGSKVVDVEGNPLVVYHGTRESGFTEFDFERTGQNYEEARGTGIHFTDSVDIAVLYSGVDSWRTGAYAADDGFGGSEFYGEATESGVGYRTEGDGAVYPAYLRIENPLVVEASEIRMGGEDAVRKALADGHDGVIINNVDWNAAYKSRDTQYVVFSPAQIKSATGNVGTFDPANPDIRYMPAEPLKPQFKSRKKTGSLGGVQQLVHFSSVPLTTLDPAEASGRGAATAVDLRGLPRGYFYRLGKGLYEDAIVDRPNIYMAEVDGNSIYNLAEDPLGYAGIPNRELADQMLRDAGFAGMHGISGGVDMVAMFEPVKLTEATRAEAKIPRQPKPKALPPLKPLEAEEIPDYDNWFEKMQQQEAAPRRRRLGGASPASFMPDDAAYLRAVEQGDMTTAQRMVDAAARGEGPFYHRSGAGGIDVFYPWTNFGTAEQAAAVDLSGRSDGAGRTYKVYLDIANPLRVEDQGMSPSNVLEQALERGVITGTEYSNFPFNSSDAAERAYAIRVLRSKGYDGLVYSNEWEGVGDSFVAFAPTQIKSADPVTYDDQGNVIPLSERFDVSTPDIRFMPDEAAPLADDGIAPTFRPLDPPVTSALDILYGNRTLAPERGDKSRGLSGVASELSKAAIELLGRRVTSKDITPAEFAFLAAVMVAETLAALRREGHAGDWYTSDLKRARVILEALFPEMSDIEAARERGFDSPQDADLVITTALAITSQNLSVPDNSRYALEQYEFFRENGRFDPSQTYGNKGASISTNLELANTLIDKYGFAGLREFVNADFRVSELSARMSEELGRKVTIAGRADDIVKGSAVFGPKIGQGFLQNLLGNLMPVTVDLWFRRTWGRLTGDVKPEGIKSRQWAAILDAYREAGVKLPPELRNLRVVDRRPKSKRGQTYRDLTPETFERIKRNDALLDQAQQLISEQASRWARMYKELRFMLPPELANAYRRGEITLEQLNRKQQPILRARDRAWETYKQRMTRAGRKPGTKKTAEAAGGYLYLLDRQQGRTDKLTNPEMSAGKPAWARATDRAQKAAKPIDAPTDQDREVLTRLVETVRERLRDEHGIDMSPADIQATLWYPEKDIWAILNGEDASTLKNSYGIELLKIADKRGLGDRARELLQARGD